MRDINPCITSGTNLSGSNTVYTSSQPKPLLKICCQTTYILICRIKLFECWLYFSVEDYSVAMNDGSSLGESGFTEGSLGAVVRAHVPRTGQNEHTTCTPNSRKELSTGSSHKQTKKPALFETNVGTLRRYLLGL